MRKKIKISSFSIIFLLIFNMSYAYATTNTDIDFNNKLIDGKNIAYMIQSGVEYTLSIPNAVSKLMYPSNMSNNLVLNPTNSYMTSKMDFYQYRDVTDRSNAYASVFVKNSSGGYDNSTGYMDSKDWLFGKIYINDYYMGDLNNTVREAVIIHEMLHVYGLKDINKTSSIMYYETPYVTGVTSDANAVLNNKYK